MRVRGVGGQGMCWRPVRGGVGVACGWIHPRSGWIHRRALARVLKRGDLRGATWRRSARGLLGGAVRRSGYSGGRVRHSAQVPSSSMVCSTSE